MGDSAKDEDKPLLGPGSKSGDVEEGGCGLECDRHGAVEVKRNDEACSTACKGMSHFFCNLHWWFMACFFNVLLSPILLLYHAIRLQVVPCLGMYVERGLCTCLASICCESCFKFTDSEFPPNSASLGDTSKKFKSGEAPKEARCCESQTYLEVGGEIEWKRGDTLLEKKGDDKVQLFSGGVTPADVAQGQLGNCWLLAALATLADHKNAIQICFESKQFNPRGRYRIKLWDPLSKDFEVIAIDDYIPTQNGKTVFANPNGNELWVLLIEKAFAKSKYYGTYAALEGGLPCYALLLLTGGECFHFSKKDANEWKAMGVQGKTKEENGKDKAYIGLSMEDYTASNDKMFEDMTNWLAQGHILAAGSEGKDNTIAEGRGGGKSIVPGHAYSILNCGEYGGQKLIRLRNPWGTFEWDGDWSNKSTKWNENPNVRSAVEGEVKAVPLSSLQPKNVIEPGTFWMSWDDFLTYFIIIDYCKRVQNIDQLQMDGGEDLGCSGPAVGCFCGCCDYWFLCNGPGMLYCNRLYEIDDREGSSDNISCRSLCCCCKPEQEEGTTGKKDVKTQKLGSTAGP